MVYGSDRALVRFNEICRKIGIVRQKFGCGRILAAARLDPEVEEKHLVSSAYCSLATVRHRKRERQYGIERGASTYPSASPQLICSGLVKACHNGFPVELPDFS